MQQKRLGAVFCCVMAFMLNGASFSYAEDDITFAGKNAGRSVQDITAALSHYKPDPAVARLARNKVDATPPVTDSQRDLIQFYRDRAQAAESLGLFEQQLADLREAVDQSKGQDGHQNVVSELAVAEANGGNVLTSINLRLKQIKHAQGVPKDLVDPYAILARLYVFTGDLAAAGEALAKSEAAYDEIRTSPKKTLWALINQKWKFQIEASRAEILQAQGKMKESEQSLKVALDTWRDDLSSHKLRLSLGKKGESDGIREMLGENIEQKLAIAMLQQGKVIEAEIASRNVLSKTLTRTGRYSAPTGQALTTLATIISAQGRYHEAAILAKEAIDSLAKAGVPAYSYFTVTAVKRYAEILAMEGRWAEALKQYSALDQALAATPNLHKRFAKGDLVWGLSLVKAGGAAKAAPLLDQVLQDTAAIYGDTHYATAEIRSALAMALAGTGDFARASDEYGRAIDVLTGRDASDADEEGGGERKARRRSILLSGYIDFLYKAGQREPAKARQSAVEAFHIADVVRGQSVQKALAESAARAAANTPAMAGMVRKEQDIEREIGAQFALLSDVLALAPSQQDAQAVKVLRGNIERLKAERIPLKQEIAARFPEYANLVNPPPLTAGNLSSLLSGGEALVSFLISDEGEYVWAVRKDGRVAFARMGMKRSELARSVAQLRKALDAEASAVEEIPKFDTELAYRVFAATLKPVEPVWQDADTLLLVPDGALSQLPAVLLTTQPGRPGKDINKVAFTGYRAIPWLVRKVAVVQLPTVSSLQTLRAMPAAKPGRLAFAGFGDPYFSKAQQAEAEHENKPAVPEIKSADTSVPTTRTKREAVDAAELAQLPRLPDTREELQAIAQVLGANAAQDVFVGAAANESTVKKMNLANRRVIAFATHGLTPGDLDGLSQPALALSSPTVTGGDGDGLLTVEEILGLKLDADWVVLSACNTASSDGAGGEALSGLGRAFFYAGTRAMLVTHWPVESSAARLLTTGVFKRYAQNNGTSRAQALRASMLDMIDHEQYTAPGAKQSAFAYAHPIFWAPYTLVGDGGI